MRHSIIYIVNIIYFLQCRKDYTSNINEIITTPRYSICMALQGCSNLKQIFVKRTGRNLFQLDNWYHQSASRPEADQSNLRRRPETFRWAPIAGTPADIDPELSKPVQPCRIRLVHADEKVPGPELTAVCVPGKLQVKSSFSCRRGRPGLMSKQDF